MKIGKPINGQISFAFMIALNLGLFLFAWFSASVIAFLFWDISIDGYIFLYCTVGMIIILDILIYLSNKRQIIKDR